MGGRGASTSGGGSGSGASTSGGGGGDNISMAQVVDTLDGYQNKRHYIDINNTLRDSSFNTYELNKNEIKEKVKILDKATNLTKLKENRTLYRGVDIDRRTDAKFAKMIENVKVGDVFKEKGFLSTSTKKTEITQQKFRFIINAKKGQKGIDVNKLNKNGRWKSEFEYILPRDTKLKVSSVRKYDRHTTINVDIV